MRIVDAFRRAEKQGMNSAKRGAEMVCTGIHKAEASLRHAVQRSPEPSPDVKPEAAPKARTGIVSVNGQDVGEMRCTGGR